MSTWMDSPFDPGPRQDQSSNESLPEPVKIEISIQSPTLLTVSHRGTSLSVLPGSPNQLLTVTFTGRQISVETSQGSFSLWETRPYENSPDSE
jgi:hypothetical protein